GAAEDDPLLDRRRAGAFPKCAPALAERGGRRRRRARRRGGRIAHARREAGHDGLGAHRAAQGTARHARLGRLGSAQLLASSKRRSSSLPRATASSSACWASLVPAQTASSSSLMMSRICTKLPKRRPLEFGVGGLSVICSIAVSVPGFLS